ncbi:MAG: VRR-NUC domain-containing protein [Gammaproteobacteria bacterium]|nr:VRR-NUC domain-containing protein [Gammaproteobacteria bacterium]
MAKAKVKRKPPANIEEREQIWLIQFMGLAYFRHTDGTLRPVLDYLVAIPNGGKRSKAIAGKLKAQGVKKGVSDLFLPVPLNERNGLWIEFKAAKGRATPEQLEWIDRMVDVGYLAMVIWGWKSAVEAIDAYLGGLYTAAGVKLKLEKGKAAC